MRRCDRTIPQAIEKLVQGLDYAENSMGLSGAQVRIYEDFVLKIEPVSPRTEGTAAVMRWLEGKTPAPRVLAWEKQDGMGYLLMTKVRGKMACDEEFMRSPPLLCSLLGQTLRSLWSVDIQDCPREFPLEAELLAAEEKLGRGEFDIEEAHPGVFGEGGFASPRALLDWLKENKPAPEPVLSHGDFCLPNVFFLEGQPGGLIDLDRCGVSDKWKDISLCYRSLQYNFQGVYDGRSYPGFTPELFFDALGISPDWDKIRYYILLDEFA